MKFIKKNVRRASNESITITQPGENKRGKESLEHNSMPSVGLPKEATVRPPAPSQISQTECRGLLRNYNYKKKKKISPKNGTEIKPRLALPMFDSHLRNLLWRKVIVPERDHNEIKE